MTHRPRGLLPEDASLAAAVAALPVEAEERFQERAAILEFDAGYTRAQAEATALLEIQKSLRKRKGKQ